MEKVIRSGKKIFKSALRTKVGCYLAAGKWLKKIDIDCTMLGFKLKYTAKLCKCESGNKFSCIVKYDIVKENGKDS